MRATFSTCRASAKQHLIPVAGLVMHGDNYAGGYSIVMISINIGSYRFEHVCVVCKMAELKGGDVGSFSTSADRILLPFVPLIVRPPLSFLVFATNRYSLRSTLCSKTPRKRTLPLSGVMILRVRGEIPRSWLFVVMMI